MEEHEQGRAAHTCNPTATEARKTPVTRRIVWLHSDLKDSLCYSVLHTARIACTHLHVHTYTLYVYKYTHIHIYAHTLVHTHIYTHTYIYIYTHTHSHSL